MKALLLILVLTQFALPAQAADNAAKTDAAKQVKWPDEDPYIVVRLVLRLLENHPEWRNSPEFEKKAIDLATDYTQYVQSACSYVELRRDLIDADDALKASRGALDPKIVENLEKVNEKLRDDANAANQSYTKRRQELLALVGEKALAEMDRSVHQLYKLDIEEYKDKAAGRSK